MVVGANNTFEQPLITSYVLDLIFIFEVTDSSESQCSIGSNHLQWWYFSYHFLSGVQGKGFLLKPVKKVNKQKILWRAKKIQKIWWWKIMKNISKTGQMQASIQNQAFPYLISSSPCLSLTCPCSSTTGLLSWPFTMGLPMMQ
jgi:hypothetical protein